MRYISRRLSGIITFVLFFAVVVILCSSCNSKGSKKFEDLPMSPISKSEIIAFQNAYGTSFNGVSDAIADETYYELKAKEHIDNFYSFDESEVMFKIGHDDDQPFRYSHSGLLSYLIGKNKAFPNDTGIAKAKWRKIDWNNMGTIMERDVAIAIGKVTMENDEDTIHQNYTMVLKRNEKGKIKLVAHKISIPCGQQ